MFDTFEAETNIPIPAGAVEQFCRQGVEGWKPSFHGGADRPNGDQDYIVTLTHGLSGLRLLMRPGGHIFKVTGSMPRLLGHLGNGINLKGPEDLETVRCAILARLKEIAGITYDRPPSLTLTRLDLALNLSMPPGTVLALHRHARHPMIRRETNAYHNESSDSRRDVNSIVLPGTRTRISLYDKKTEIYRRGRRGSSHDSKALRVEIQLKKTAHIAKQMPQVNRSFIDFTDLRFDLGYLAFRNIMLQFPTGFSIQQEKPNLVTALALLENYGPLPELGNMSALDWYKIHHCSRSYQRLRHELGKIQRGTLSKTLVPFRWGDHLPQDRLPDLVDVNHDGEETVVPSPYIIGLPSHWGPIPSH